ncbi:IS110 family transposase [Bradyrhizobium sp. BR 1432]|uniref:IS110 family transposase n=1 Tax=Bradyrhizobium sp. BR 1432 TaxID=3447966 RepID=UPI003EE5A587
MAKHSTICAGIDTGKRKLDVAIEGRGEQLQVKNTAEGHEALLTWLRQQRVKRIGIEASGGYEQPVVAELRRKGFVVVVFQPAQVRGYAKFHLQRAKNDKIDAALIAACTAAVRKIHAAPDPRLLPFAEQLTMIDQIGEDIARLKNRIESCRNVAINQLWRKDITRLEQRERAALKALVASLREHPDLAKRLALINSVDGIGLPTAVAILVRLPEIGRITREQAVALAGLAPYDDDSGDQVGVRHIEGGRKRLRRALYTASLAASFRWNPQLIQLYQRLTAAGKEHKRALVACARKMLIFANTVVARGTAVVRRTAGRITFCFLVRPGRASSSRPTAPHDVARSVRQGWPSLARTSHGLLPGHALTDASTASSWQAQTSHSNGCYNTHVVAIG